MKPSHRLKLVSLALVLSLGALACNLGAGADPTPLPPTPTDVPLQPTTPPEPTAEPTPDPVVEPTEVGSISESVPGLEITMVNGYLDNFGSWNVVGIVRNNTDRDIDSIEIEVELFDASDNSLYADTTFADLFNIAPGEETPFSMTIFEDLPDADHYVATIVGNSTTDLARAQLTLANMAMVHDDSGDTHITGEFINDNDFPVFINSLSGATFDASGLIQTADDYSVSIRYLDPGESGPFRISITGPDFGTGDIDSYTVYVDAEEEDPIPPFDISLSDAYDYLDVFNGLHLVGTVTNNSDSTLNIRLVAGIYDAEGTVLDASSVDLPINALKPGETSPYDLEFWGPLNYTESRIDSADSYTLQVDAYWTWETSVELVDLATQNDTNEFDEFDGQFEGEVVNNTGGPIESVTIVVYMVDLQSGQVVGTGYDYVFDEIADGASAPYTVYIDIPEGFDVNSAQFEIIVKGEPVGN